jgi:threonylcarbamoyladenosine tRNA methylthiotransferase MtaB
MEPPLRLSDLLSVILQKTSVPRIRLSSIELGEVTDEILHMMAEGKICNHLHLPLQGATNRILIDMNRSYSLSGFKSGIEHIRRKAGNITIGSDIMVGFPGETEDEFEESVENVSALGFSYIHVFPFSYRPGTIAATLKDQVGEDVKKKRSARMLQKGQSLHLNFLKQNIGTYQDMIVEVSTDKYAYGTTSSYIKVRIPAGQTSLPGNLIRIAITDVEGTIALGVPVNKS